MWLLAFAGELGDVASRPSPHGILDASVDTQVGGFPQKSGLVCASICQGLSGELGGSGLVESLPA